MTNRIDTTVILITGHPATGKTTFAHFLAQELALPLIWKDQIKESLIETLGTSDTEWSRKLGTAAWTLLYKQVENLLKASISFLVESNFDPIYANEHWEKLAQKYNFRLIQIRCETEPGILLKRYVQRIKEGDRHLGHVDASKDKDFIESIKQPLGWIMVESDRLSFDTTEISQDNYLKIAQEIRNQISTRTN